MLSTFTCVQGFFILPDICRKLLDLLVEFDFAYYFSGHLYFLVSSETDQYEFVVLVM